VASAGSCPRAAAPRYRPLAGATRTGIAALKGQFEQLLPVDTARALAARAADYVAAGVPRIWPGGRRPHRSGVGQRHRRIRRESSNRWRWSVASISWWPPGLAWDGCVPPAERLSARTHWEKLAGEAVIDDLYVRQADMTASVAALAGGRDAEAALGAWIDGRRPAVERIDPIAGGIEKRRETGSGDSGGGQQSVSRSGRGGIMSTPCRYR